MTEILKLDIGINQKLYNTNLTLNKGWSFKGASEAKSWFNAFFKKFFEENPTLSPTELIRANERGVFLKDGRIISHPDLFMLKKTPAASTAKKAALVWGSLPAVSEKQTEIKTNNPTIAKPEASHELKGVAKADFAFLEPTHLLNKIPPAPRWNSEATAHLSKEGLSRLEANYLLSKNGDKPESNSAKETRLGTRLGVEKREDYRMSTTLMGKMSEFFKTTSIRSDDILAKNSPLNGCKTQDGVISGAISSSYNRHADTITMLRKIEAEDGSSTCYAGRVDTLPKAKEMARFLFLGEIERFEDFSGLSKGIQLREDGNYELTFAVQSLLNMHVFDSQQKNMFEKQLEAYNRLAKESKKTPLEITHPETGKTYKVVVNPLAIAANQFNWSNYLPNFLGESTAQAYSIEADKALQKLAEAKIKQLRAGDNQKKINQIEDTLDALLNNKLKKSWEKILARAYLVTILDLPEVIHCKSSVDRTGGAAIPMVFALKEWLKTGRPLPLVNGRYSTSAIADHSITDDTGEKIYPFKELVALKMIHELKMSEFARGDKGYKIREGGILHPALKDLLPERYLDISSFWSLFNDFKSSYSPAQNFLRS